MTSPAEFSGSDGPVPPTEGPQKAVLCRPLCGFNDQLNQIAICLDYARTSGRVLVVDTRLGGMRDEFANYFDLAVIDSQEVGIITDAEAWIQSTPLRTIWPASVDRLTPIRCRVDSTSGHNVRRIPRSNEIPDVRLAAGVSADIVLHQQCGGGSRGLEVLRRVVCKPRVLKHIEEARSRLLEPYSAVHIRHSDVKSDYRRIIVDVAESEPSLKIWVSTDSAQVARYARSVLGERLLGASEVPDTGGRRLHANRTLDPWATNVTMLVDLYVLSNADRLRTTSTLDGRRSGFGRLASRLRDSPDIRRSLFALGDPDSCHRR